ncbi:hypothetical protein HanIR_Chr11g0529891 [Helianthus annuus]|nr:hypothetical protein HanIR_Chr11g0529891 [Helianthus annuus]
MFIPLTYRCILKPYIYFLHLPSYVESNSKFQVMRVANANSVSPFLSFGA